MDKQHGERLFTKAQKIINGERRDQYGKPQDAFTLIGDLWTRYIHSISKRGHRLYGKIPYLNPKDVAFMMVLLKVAREMHKHKRDNLVDMAGYLGLLDDMEIENERN